MPSDPRPARPAAAPAGWELRRVAETGSTNADLAVLAADGAAEGLVLTADRQTAGRGRLDRTWTAPPGSGLTFSVLVRPAVPPARLGWLPLLTGLAVAEAVREVAGVAASVKWPNDVVVGERKLAGVLSQAVPDASDPAAPAAVVVGVGLNVSLGADDLPVPTATSLALEGGTTTDGDAVLSAVLDVLAARYRSWTGAGGDPDASGVRPAYLVRCATVGRDVRVELPTAVLEGQAIGVDLDGRLRVTTADGTVHDVAAGDVVHLR